MITKNHPGLFPGQIVEVIEQNEYLGPPVGVQAVVDKTFTGGILGVMQSGHPAVKLRYLEDVPPLTDRIVEVRCLTLIEP